MSSNQKYSRQELDHIRQSVHCGALLELNGFKLDPRESSKKHLKYKNNGETIIVTHEGHGWWDPHNTDKGDVVALQMRLSNSMSFLDAIHSLAALTGISPEFPEVFRKIKDKPPITSKDLLAKKPLEPDTECWNYLTKERAIPSEILIMAAKQKVIRQGIKGTSYFLHKEICGNITGAEMRGPQYKGCVRGGDKSLFCFMGGDAPILRLVITEAAIDALSFAALDPITNGTLYVSTGGGMGPGTLKTLDNLMEKLSVRKRVVIEIATDKDKGGEGFAELLLNNFQQHGLIMRRTVPTGEYKDWNDLLTGMQDHSENREEQNEKAAETV